MTVLSKGKVVLSAESLRICCHKLLGDTAVDARFDVVLHVWVTL